MTKASNLMPSNIHQASARSARGSKLQNMSGHDLIGRLTAALARLSITETAATGLRDIRIVNEVARELEARYVLVARSEGLSWAQIGTRIDLTKQGAQQFVRRDRQRVLTGRGQQTTGEDVSNPENGF